MTSISVAALANASQPATMRDGMSGCKIYSGACSRPAMTTSLSYLRVKHP